MGFLLLSFAVISLLLTPVAPYLLYARRVYRKRTKGLPLPPGPKGWPLIGNALDIPLVSMGPVYASWAKKFGKSVVSFIPFPWFTRLCRLRHSQRECVRDNYGYHRLLRHGHRAIGEEGVEVLVQVRAIFSVRIDHTSSPDFRPVSVLACDVMGWDCIFVLNPYSDAWKERRRLFARYFRSSGHSDAASVTAVHIPQVNEFVHRFLLDLNETPGEVYGLVRQ
jgi:hypothetical protein